jgi:hypothetical protein
MTVRCVISSLYRLTLQEIEREIGNYGINQLNRIFRVTINAAGNTSSREPDVTLTRPNNVPTIIVDLEDKN